MAFGTHIDKQYQHLLLTMVIDRVYYEVILASKLIFPE